VYSFRRQDLCGVQQAMMCAQLRLIWLLAWRASARSLRATVFLFLLFQAMRLSTPLRWLLMH
jgi:hypothetical protein